MAKDGFDPKCLELAKYFLVDFGPSVNTEANQNALAQTIQSAVENYINDLDPDL